MNKWVDPEKVGTSPSRISRNYNPNSADWIAERLKKKISWTEVLKQAIICLVAATITGGMGLAIIAASGQFETDFVFVLNHVHS